MQQYVFRLTVLFFSLISLSVTTPRAQAQTHEFVYYGADEGLPSRVSCMVQDSFGNIFTGTTFGVQFFDGYSFSGGNGGNTRGPGAWVWQMKKRPNGIWTLGSAQTVYVIDDRTTRSHPANKEIFYNHKSSRHSSFQVKNGDTVNIGYTNQSFYRQLLPDSSVRKVPLDDIIGIPSVYVLNADDKNNELFGSYFPNGSTGKLNYLWVDGSTYNIPPLGSNSRILAKWITDSTTAVSVGKHLFLINRKSKKLLNFQKLDTEVLAIEPDHYATIWTGHRDGITQFSAKLDSVLLDNTQLKFVCAIMQDREQNMWFGSIKGIHKLLNPNICTFSEIDGELVTREKVPSLSNIGNETYAFSEGNLFQIVNDAPKKLLKFSDHDVRARALSKGDGNILYVAGTKGIHKYQDNSFKKILPAVQSIHNIVTDSNNSFWVSRGTFVRQYDSSGSLLFDSSTLPDSLQAHDTKFPTHILCGDHKNGIWMVYDRKLTHLSDGRLHDYSKHPGHEKIKESSNYSVINHDLWLSSFTAGVNVLHSDSFYNITTADGLASNRCLSLTRESDSSIWISSIHGIQLLTYRFHGKDLHTRIEIFDKDDGLSTSFSHALAKMNDYLWISHRDGFSRFNTKVLSTERHLVRPTIKIIDIWVNDQRQHNTGPFNLDYNENRVAVHLKGISFKGRSTPRYQYRLVGNDSNWQFTTDTVVNLGPLAAGHYTFEARTITKRGLASARPAYFLFSIAPPYWRTWWFITLMVILSQSVVVGLILVYTRLRRRALLSDKKSLEAELRAIRSQINPHFMFNALNNLQERLKDSESELSSKHLNSFAELMRKVLWASRQTRISVKDEMEITQLYLGFATGHYRGKISYSFDVSPQVRGQEELLQLPPLITQPLVENAVLHGAAKSQEDLGIVHMKVSMDKSNIVIDISDNGPGFSDKKTFDSDKTRESVGSKLIMEHIDLLNQGSRQKIKYRVERIQNETHVILIIPIDI